MDKPERFNTLPCFSPLATKKGESLNLDHALETETLGASEHPCPER